MSTREAEKRLAAARAVDEIKDGMFVGLGTGSTTAYAIQSLSDRIRQGLRITAVATSRATTIVKWSSSALRSCESGRVFSCAEL